ncbi:MAG: Asp-tRNA(Asn)/Glu-tRNA(Gln) amidotransferase subunit GatC [Candidatus Hydrogenedentota bacterium]|nr:MAG: Asp-tRNA(Asn)/Glu-tRNA(Gln) amidotransferase subunit GatC [Candidatus Hydrogenedentota bacterium]
MKITREMIEHVAKLARLSFGERELEGFISQLNEILQYVEKLNELDTTNVPPTSHMFFTRTPMRDDKVRAEESPIAKLLENAPRREDNFYVVPRVIE